jgi:hypothetical protein
MRQYMSLVATQRYKEYMAINGRHALALAFIACLSLSLE